MSRVRQDIMGATIKKRINFSMKNTMKKLNAIAHEANAIQIVRDLKLIIEINKKIIEAFVYFEIISNFVFQFIVNKYNFDIIKFKNSQYLLMISEDKLKTIIIKKQYLYSC